MCVQVHTDLTYALEFILSFRAFRIFLPDFMLHLPIEIFLSLKWEQILIEFEIKL